MVFILCLIYFIYYNVFEVNVEGFSKKPLEQVERSASAETAQESVPKEKIQLVESKIVKGPHPLPVVTFFFNNPKTLEEACLVRRFSKGSKHTFSSGGKVEKTKFEAKDGGTATIKEIGGTFEARFTGNALQEYCDENIMKQIPSHDESNDDFKALLSKKGWVPADSKRHEMKEELKDEIEIHGEPGGVRTLYAEGEQTEEKEKEWWKFW